MWTADQALLLSPVTGMVLAFVLGWIAGQQR